MSGYPLPTTTLEEANLRPEQIARLHALIEGHIKAGRYPGAQIAIARHGKLAHFKTFGEAKLGQAADEASMGLLFSNTKVIAAAACWTLAEQGAFRCTDKFADHVPAFARNGKGDVTIMQVITHLGGFPNAEVGPECWEDHGKLHDTVCNFSLEFTPGSRLHYHGASAHWALGVLIEKLTGQDFRTYIREAVIAPMGLTGEMQVGLDAHGMAHAVDMHEPKDDGVVPAADRNSDAFKKAGVPGGGYATARAMAAFYQMMLAGGTIGGDFTGERVDEYMGLPMHRGLGPHSRGGTPVSRGLGAIAHPRTFGHGGVGSSYCWADPESGLSFAFLSNTRQNEQFHSQRMDTLSTLAHAAIIS